MQNVQFGDERRIRRSNEQPRFVLKVIGRLTSLREDSCLALVKRRVTSGQDPTHLSFQLVKEYKAFNSSSAANVPSIPSWQPDHSQAADSECKTKGDMGSPSSQIDNDQTSIIEGP